MLTASLTTEAVASVGATEAFNRRACTSACTWLAPVDGQQHIELPLDGHILCDDLESGIGKAPMGTHLAFQLYSADLCVW